MTNPVYTMTARALSGVVSERAAETMLRAALREQNVNAETVTAQEMQKVLSGPLLTRLSAAMPAGRARQELQRLSSQLAMQYPKAPTLFEEVEPYAAWDESPEVTNGGWVDLNLSADDFEFDDPEYTSGLSARRYNLEEEAEQEALIQELGRLNGVQGIMICRSSGEILRLRALQDASKLSGAVAATAMLFQRQSLSLMAAELGGRTVCVRPLGAYCVAVVAGQGLNAGRLLAELQQVQVSA
ncbi:roadblock/LC7 domain-containing protein [Deinococcus hohokamensis]|uniref:Roadblock/LC7 domain-containing protein n=1 Tax=Deinococcus hohokamensis TaxID=309883 RepID=A0ABV9IEE0_9DEIO